MRTLTKNSDAVEWQLRYCRARYLVMRKIGRKIE